LEQIWVSCQRATEVGCGGHVAAGFRGRGETTAVPVLEVSHAAVHVIGDLLNNSTTGVGNCNDISLGVGVVGVDAADFVIGRAGGEGAYVGGALEGDGGFFIFAVP
jgi:hypothetical protein